MWNTYYVGVARDQLRAAGHPVRDEDIARLSPFMRKHRNVLGLYSFALPEMPGGHGDLRDPDTPDDDED